MSSWIMEKARMFQENIYFWFIDYTKDFDCVDHNKLWKILKVREKNLKKTYIHLNKSSCCRSKRKKKQKTGHCKSPIDSNSKYTEKIRPER